MGLLKETQLWQFQRKRKSFDRPELINCWHYRRKKTKLLLGELLFQSGSCIFRIRRDLYFRRPILCWPLQLMIAACLVLFEPVELASGPSSARLHTRFAVTLPVVVAYQLFLA
jgi:hypothetical protein